MASKIEEIKLTNWHREDDKINLSLQLPKKFVPDFIALILQTKIWKITLKRDYHIEEIREISLCVNSLRDDESKVFLETIEKFAETVGTIVLGSSCGEPYDFEKQRLR